MTRDETGSDHFARSVLLGRTELETPTPPPGDSWWRQFLNALAGRADSNLDDSAHYRPPTNPPNPTDDLQALEHQLAKLKKLFAEDAVRQANGLENLKSAQTALETRIAALERRTPAALYQLLDSILDAARDILLPQIHRIQELPHLRREPRITPTNASDAFQKAVIAARKRLSAAGASYLDPDTEAAEQVELLTNMLSWLKSLSGLSVSVEKSNTEKTGL